MAVVLGDIAHDLKMGNLRMSTAVKDKVSGFLADGEQIEMVFENIGEKLYFTDLRIIAARSQGLAKNAMYFSYPYSMVRCFVVDADDTLTVTKDDSEVLIVLENGQKLQFDFKTKFNYQKLSTLLLGREARRR